MTRIDHNDEISSDGDSVCSCSDAEPELQDYENDTCSGESDVDTDDRNENVRGREWRYVASCTEDVQLVSQNATLTAKCSEATTMAECFHLFISENIIDIIVKYTNKKAQEVYNRKELRSSWKPVDRIEVNAFLGLLLTIGRFGESRENKNDLWTKNLSLSGLLYAAVMSCNRFRQILQFIRFDDFTTREKRRANDKLASLRNVTNIFSANCREAYNASSEGTIDEQLVTFRGRCSFKVYMPQKPRKYGIKIWTLCDNTTYFCCNLDVYVGKIGNTVEKTQGQRVVKELTEFWSGSGRVITCNNFFTDISLAEELLDKNIHLVGTVRKNRMDRSSKNTCQYTFPRYIFINFSIHP